MIGDPSATSQTVTTDSTEDVVSSSEVELSDLQLLARLLLSHHAFLWRRASQPVFLRDRIYLQIDKSTHPSEARRGGAAALECRAYGGQRWD